MTYLGIAYGLALVALGVFGYFKSGAVSVTALIPAFLGTPVTVLALLSLNPKFLKIGMHIIVVIALLGFIATACLLYTSPSPRDATLSRMPSSA